MAKTRVPKLSEMRIRPSENGGHNVSHTFAAKPSFAKGSLLGGMTMAQPPAKEFNFGPGDHAALLKHIAGALALKGLPSQTSAGGQGGAPPSEEPPLAD